MRISLLCERKNTIQRAVECRSSKRSGKARYGGGGNAFRQERQRRRQRRESRRGGHRGGRAHPSDPPQIFPLSSHPKEILWFVTPLPALLPTSPAPAPSSTIFVVCRCFCRFFGFLLGRLRLVAAGRCRCRASSYLLLYPLSTTTARTVSRLRNPLYRLKTPSTTSERPLEGPDPRVADLNALVEVVNSVRLWLEPRFFPLPPFGTARQTGSVNSIQTPPP